MRDTDRNDQESSSIALGGGLQLKEALQSAGVDPSQLSAEELGLVREVLSQAAGGNGASSETRERTDDAYEAEADDRTTTAADVDRNGSGPTAGASMVEPSDAPKIARLTVGVAQELTKRSIRSYTRTSTRFLRAAATAESPVELLDESQDIVREEAERLGLDSRQRDGQRASLRRDSERDQNGTADRDEDAESLLERGTRLLELSADVTTEESTHPAYSRILDELALDEARILRLLAIEGAQPVVDIYDGGWLPLGSELVAEQISMLGPEAGCRADADVSAHLNNLQRLGLVAITDEPVDDLTRYQVLQAQPEVEEAMAAANRGTINRRKVHLTPFGVDFCRTCLPVAVDAEQAAGAAQPTVEPEESSTHD